MSPAQIKWMTGREMSSQTSAKQTNAPTQRNWIHRWFKVQIDTHRPNNKSEYNDDNAKNNVD